MDYFFCSITEYANRDTVLQNDSHYINKLLIPLNPIVFEVQIYTIGRSVIAFLNNRVFCVCRGKFRRLRSLPNCCFSHFN